MQTLKKEPAPGSAAELVDMTPAPVPVRTKSPVDRNNPREPRSMVEVFVFAMTTEEAGHAIEKLIPIMDDMEKQIPMGAIATKHVGTILELLASSTSTSLAHFKKMDAADALACVRAWIEANESFFVSVVDLVAGATQKRLTAMLKEAASGGDGLTSSDTLPNTVSSPRQPLSSLRQRSAA